MKTAIEIALVGLIAALALIVIPILGALAGGLGGWITGIFFGDLILGTLAACGVKGISMWQLGLTLGFISGFVRSSSTSQSSN
ncbi:MAG: hypothetical protein F6K65_30465 [Moorea sp. SIO3C2]|nr:hypothetical protein [Moorena sp. SIO3C2]